MYEYVNRFDATSLFLYPPENTKWQEMGYLESFPNLYSADLLKAQNKDTKLTLSRIILKNG